MQGCIYYAPQDTNGWAKRFLFGAGNRIEQFFYLQGDQKTQWYSRQNGFLEKSDAQKVKIFSSPSPLKKKIMYALLVPYAVMLVAKAIERLVEWLTRSTKNPHTDELKKTAKPAQISSPPQIQPAVGSSFNNLPANGINLESDTKPKKDPSPFEGEKEDTPASPPTDAYKGDTPMPVKKTTISKKDRQNLETARKLFETPPLVSMWQKLITINFLNENQCYRGPNDPAIGEDEGLLHKILDSMPSDNEFEVLQSYFAETAQAKKSFQNLTEPYERKLPANEKERTGFVNYFKSLFQKKAGLQERLSFFYEGTEVPSPHEIIEKLRDYWKNHFCSLKAIRSKEYQGFALSFQLFTKGLSLLNELDSFRDLNDTGLSELELKQAFILYPLLALNCLAKFQVFIKKYPLENLRTSEKVWDDLELQLKGPVPLPPKKKEKESAPSSFLKKVKPEPLRELFSKITFAFTCYKKNAFTQVTPEEHLKNIASILKQVLNEDQKKSLKGSIKKLDSGNLLGTHFLDESTARLLCAQFLVNLTARLRKMENEIAKRLAN